MTILRVGSNEKYADGWDRAFGDKAKKKTAAAKPSKPVKGAKSSAAKKKAKAKKTKK